MGELRGSPFFLGEFMKKLILLLICLYAAPSYATMTTEQFTYALGISAPQYQQALSAASNIKSTVQFSQYTPIGNVQSGWFVGNGVEILRPVGTSSAEMVAPMVILGGSSGSKVLMRKALGFLGPVATAVTIGLTLNDLYNEVNSHPSSYPLLSHASGVDTNVSHPFVGLDLTLSFAGTRFDFAGKHYEYSGSYLFLGPLRDSARAAFVPYMNGTSEIVLGIQSASVPENLDTYSKGCFEISSLTAPSTVSQFEDVIAPHMMDTYFPEIDNAIKTSLTSGTAVSYPSSSQISALKDVVNVKAATDAALAATQTAINTAQVNYTANPTPENRQILDNLLAQQAAQVAAQVKEDLIIAPDLPTNAYDPTITAPDKKDISSLLGFFISSSPLVSMVRSFTINTSSASCSMPVGTVYGQQLSFDFCRYQSLLLGCGGILLIIMHGFAVFIVIRGW